ncbi:MAG: class I SAM-dependent methyltransferase [Cytophagales bacterium]|nr:class I SAM-dependent methyltransferase [Cytophagales bacterium]
MDTSDFELITSEEGQAFLQAHEHSDPNQLVLNPPKKDYPEVSKNIRLFVDQLISQKKAVKKLPSWKATPGLVYPPPLSLEQSSSEETATYKKELIRGKTLVDLTGGMGIDCMALSENFEETHYVEKNPDLCAVFIHNAKQLGKEAIHVNHTEASDFLARRKAQAGTCFYFDPARRGENNSKVFKLTDCEPDASQLVPRILEKGATSLIKTSPMLDVDLALSELTNVKEVHLVAVKNELKEVLYLIQPDWEEEPSMIAVNLARDKQEFNFRKSEEANADSTIGSVQNWLYEPNVAVMKAGAYKLIGQQFGLTKLDVNSHLYTSKELVPGFPGRIFEVIEEMTKSNLKKLLPDQKANIITRNYPLTPDQLKKKYKLKDGGEYFVIGMRSLGKPLLLLCKQIEKNVILEK